MKILSLVPGGTETVRALGLADHLIASNELETGVDLVIESSPAPVRSAVSKKARHLSFSPRTLEDIFEAIRSVGEAAGALEEAKALVYRLRNRAMSVQRQWAASKNKPRVYVLEGLDPLSRAGRWIPEMVEIAGGVAHAEPDGRPAAPVSWEDVALFDPDILIVASSGRHLEEAIQEMMFLKKGPICDKVRACREGNVYVVDADSYFTRPGPRVMDGIELLAHLFYPEAAGWSGPSNAYKKMLI
ncbi:MAG: ABC transporter substrate-binding protein [Elusimicrobia bacterium]|nr:ABC transporter substrate-binding protein [Elusimicrobiota bacterium]